MKKYTKLVIRHLPPDLDEAKFRESIEEFKDNLTWSYYHAGRARAIPEATRSGVAYLNFKTPKQVREFSAKFTNHVFLDQSGHEHVVQIEYALFQRVPRSKRPRDKLMDSYEKDAHYVAFVESLKKEPEVLPSAEKQLEQKEKDAEQKKAAGETTEPLLQILAEIKDGSVPQRRTVGGSYPSGYKREKPRGDDKKQRDRRRQKDNPRLVKRNSGNVKHDHGRRMDKSRMHIPVRKDSEKESHHSPSHTSTSEPRIMKVMKRENRPSQEEGKTKTNHSPSFHSETSTTSDVSDHQQYPRRNRDRYDDRDRDRNSGNRNYSRSRGGSGAVWHVSSRSKPKPPEKAILVPGSIKIRARQPPSTNGSTPSTSTDQPTT